MLKERAERTPADAGLRHYHCKTHDITARFTIPSASRGSSPFSHSSFLRFGAHPGCRVRRRRHQQDQAVHAVRVPSTGAADADTLHAVPIRSRTLDAAAISEGSASLMTELMTARLALIEVLDGYRQSSR